MEIESAQLLEELRVFAPVAGAMYETPLILTS
jgi:hypothetical protein